MKATLVRNLREMLPKGEGLSEDVWASRHRVITGVLIAHAIGIFLFAVFRGYEVAHSAMESSILALAALAALHKAFSRTMRSVAATLGLLTASALLVHFSGGVIEAHFHFFVMVAVVSMYQHWTPFLIAIAFVIFQHGTVGVLEPESVYNHPSAIADPWTWALIHGFFITGLCTACLTYWGMSEASTSARRRAEEALRTSEERFRSAFRHSALGMAIVGVDGPYIEVNRWLCELFGYSEKEMMRQTVLSMTHPDDRAESQELTARLLSDETDHEFHTKRYIRKDGAVVWAEVAVSIVRDGDGTPLYFISQVHDVTAKREAEEARERLAAIVEATSDFAAITSKEGEILYLNSAARKVCDMEHADITGMKILDLHPPAMEAEVKRRIAHAEKTGIWSGQTMFLSAGGEKIPASQILLAHKDATGEVEFFSTTARDLREQIKLEGQLIQAQKMEAVGRLAGGVAHDFNNLLAVILNYSQFIGEQTERTDPRWQDIEEIKMAGQRGARLVRQLLAFSRKDIVDPEVLDVNEVMDDMRSMLARVLGEHIELQITADPEVSPIKIDRGQFEQVVVNLSVNARDAMPSGGRLAIQTQNVDADDEFISQRPGLNLGTYVCVTVCDSGAGMTEDVKAHIFEPFFTTKARGEGSGLGLSTAYGIVTQAGGTISVYTEPGWGTTLRIYLPACDDQVTSPQKRSSSRKADGGDETVLVVEDERAVGDLVKRMLTRHGYDVRVVNSVEDAIEVFKEEGEKISLVLTDVILPKLSGKELVNRLANIRHGFKALFMSGYTDDIVARHGVVEADEGFIQKPFGEEELLLKVREVLDSSQDLFTPGIPLQELPAKPTVLIAEDDAGMRDVLETLLTARGFRVVGSASGGEEAVEMTRRFKPDLALLDFALTDMNADAIAPKIKELAPDIRVVVFSGVIHDAPVWADAYLAKENISDLGALLDELAAV